MNYYKRDKHNSFYRDLLLTYSIREEMMEDIIILIAPLDGRLITPVYMGGAMKAELVE